MDMTAALCSKDRRGPCSSTAIRGRATGTVARIAALLLIMISPALPPVFHSWAAWGANGELKNLMIAPAAPGDTIAVAAGNWNVSSDLEVPANMKLAFARGAGITVQPGAVLTIRGAIDAPAARLFSGPGAVRFAGNGRQRVYPQWWGAKGDGLTEDTEAFQAAINAFGAKGGEVRIPGGTYLLDAIGVKSNIALTGINKNAVLKQRSGARYCVSTDPNNMRVRPLASERSDIAFNNLTFRGTVDTDGFAEFLMLLDIRGASNVSVSKCNFIGFRGDGIYIAESKAGERIIHSSHITISASRFDGINKDNRNGISIIDGDNIVIERCGFERVSRSDMPGAIDVEPDQKFNIVRNIRIAENRFTGNGGNNIIQISITGALGSLDAPMQRIEILGNRIEGEGTANGIYVGQTHLADNESPSHMILIRDNVVKNTKRAFMVFGFKDINMVNNVFEGCDLDPYISYSTKNINVMNMRVTGNTFKDLSRKDRAGISVFGANHLEFRNNTFDNIGKADGTGGNALFFRRHGGPADYITIEGNTFTGINTTVAVQKELFSVTYPEHNRIAGNIFRGADTVALPGRL